MPRPENVTTPLIALTVTVPIRDDPAEPAVRVAVTEEPVETVLLAESWKVRTGCVVNAIALTAPAAFVVLTILVAAPTPKVMFCVATVNPVAVNVIVYEPAGPVIPRPENVTMPPTAATVTLPMSDEPADPAVMEAVTDDPVEILKLLASWNLTTGCVVKATALTAPAALVVVTILVAAAAPSVMFCVATVNPVAVNVIV
jgi:hypothetical protein